MIVKSMSRKAPTFRQLAGYIGQNATASEGCFSKNLYYQGSDKTVVSKLFFENYKNLPKRKNGNALYHEVIVLSSQPHLSKQMQTRILHDLANHYCELRAARQLVWGRAHFDTEYPHIHLMISANEFHASRRKRLTKRQFADIQKQLEIYKEHKFPELNDLGVYKRPDVSRVRTKTSEGELKRRTGKPSQKEQLSELVVDALNQSISQTDFENRLQEHGLLLYQRGKYWGVINQASGKRYRLKTLGLEQSFKALQIAHLDISKDTRARELLKQREHLADHANMQLSDFEHDDLDRDER